MIATYTILMARIAGHHPRHQAAPWNDTRRASKHTSWNTTAWNSTLTPWNSIVMNDDD